MVAVWVRVPVRVPVRVKVRVSAGSFVPPQSSPDALASWAAHAAILVEHLVRVRVRIRVRVWG